MRRLSPLEFWDYWRERRALRRSGAAGKVVAHLGYQDQTAAERIRIGLELSAGAAKARRADKR